MKQAVILAGGKGTRLHSLLADVPKPLADIEGKTLLGHQLELLKRHEFSEVIILVNHGASAITAWVSEQSDLGMKIRLLNDGEPRGTAGAVLAALPLLASEFMVLYADTMVGVDLTRFWDWHYAAPEAAGSLFLHPNDHPADSDLVEVNEEALVTRLHPYPRVGGLWLPNLVNAALYILKRKALEALADIPFPIDFGRDLFPLMLSRGLVLRGYNSPEYIKDAGTPQRLERVRRDFRSGVVDRASLDRPQRAVFIDRDGTLNQEAGHIKKPQDLHVFPFVGPALKLLNENEWRSVVITNQPVIARGEATHDEIRSIHARLDNEVAQSQAYFDRLYLCPHHPHKGFPGENPQLKVSCQCRKPAAGLIHRAQADLNIDLAQSWYVGDSTADLGAAEAAGVSSILVRTGNAGLDECYSYLQGFSQPNFAAAVDFILFAYPKISDRCHSIVSELGDLRDIFVGGARRAGKSTVAAALARELRAIGRNVVIFHTDRWYLGKAAQDARVIDRYDMNEMFDTMNQLGGRQLSGKVHVSIPTYSKKRELSLRNSRQLIIDQETTVIWEGIVALELAAKFEQLNMSVAVYSDERSRYIRCQEYETYSRLNGSLIESNRAELDKEERFFVGESLARAVCSISLDDILIGNSSGVSQ